MPVDTQLPYTADGAPGADVTIDEVVNIREPTWGCQRDADTWFSPWFLPVLQFGRAKQALSCNTECDGHQKWRKSFSYLGKNP